MKLEPERYIYNDEFYGGCAAYPEDEYPKNAQGMYSMEQINQLLESIIEELKVNPQGDPVKIVSEYIIKE